ncbi:uncharacterized protein LOC112092674 isoform X2 [Morus notabilis]|uniref:uncharacterized protein LOC112092674 isoform X2 n=1 Tax=Morus notabilis TaxID=981085 RepID=UPI000CED5018|nr:uncharacterized protein LOC112092674 isoform X2 [Morus notabilis]
MADHSPSGTELPQNQNEELNEAAPISLDDEVENEDDEEEEEDEEYMSEDDSIDELDSEEDEEEDEEEEGEGEGEGEACFLGDEGSEGNQWSASEIDGLFCPICMEPWTNDGDHHICCLPCGHIFGMSCIQKWLKKCQNQGKCPQCNRRCKLKDVRKLFAARVVAIDEEAQKRACWSKKEAEWRKMEAELQLEVQQLKESHPEVERARRKLLLDYDLYYCAFANTRANGPFEYGQDDAPPQHGSGSPIERGPTSFNDGDDVPSTNRRHGVHGESHGQHVHSPSRLIRRRSSRNSRTISPSYMKRAVDRLVTSIETSSRSRGINASATMSVQSENVEDQCFGLLATLDISQEQYLFMFNFMTTNPRWQRSFLHMPEHHRLVWIQHTMKQCANQQVSPPPPQQMPMSSFFQPTVHTNPTPANTFGQPTSPFQPFVPPFPRPPYPMPRGGDGSSHM